MIDVAFSFFFSNWMLSYLGHATVDDKVGAVDEAGLVAGEEEDGLGLLDGLAETTSREVDLTAEALSLIVAEPVLEKRGAGGEISSALVRIGIFEGVASFDLLEGGGAEGVEAEALAGVDDGQLAGHGEDGALGGGVGELRGGGADEGDDGGGVDDGGLLLAVAAEGEHGVLAAEPDALDVDVLGQVPDLLGRVDGVGVVGVHDARVVEDDVQAAPGVELLDGRLDRVLGRDVHNFGLEHGAGGRQLLGLGHGLLQSGARDVAHQDLGALAGEKNGGLEANATGFV